MRTADFFAYAREREEVRLRKVHAIKYDLDQRDLTTNPILREWSFCNVDREDDRTTVWFRENVRSQVPEEQILLATVAFRWFNRIETGRVLAGIDPAGNSVAANLFAKWSTSWARERLAEYAKPPYVTGAYIIKTPDGMNKVEGVLWCIDQFAQGNKKGLPLDHAEFSRKLILESGVHTLEGVWNILRQFPYMGDFMAYEVVTDLYNTPLLDRAPDIMTWANPGPGAARGLCRLLDAPLDDLNRGSLKDRAYMMQQMRDLLAASQYSENWPKDWKPWDMRTVEHTLCEFDKYERVSQGGRLKRRY